MSGVSRSTANGPLLVTAFGPFGGRLLNASSLVLERIRRSKRDVRIRTFPVDLVEAPRRLRQALRTLTPRAVLMLGEAGGAEVVRIETRAWNELDFSIPDVSGRQPRGERMDQGPDYLETPLPAGSILRGLSEAGFPVELSSDPGRYLCNCIYHTALRGSGVPSLFVHLPLETKLPTDQATKAIECIMDAMA